MMFNTNKHAPLNEGKCYYRKVNFKASVRKILSIKDGKVYYERLYGVKVGTQGICSLTRMRQWITGEISEKADFTTLTGAVVHPTLLCLGQDGQPLFRCSSKRAKFYIERGYAEKVDEDTIKLTEAGAKTEEMLLSLYPDLSNKPFFFAIKNDKCTVCGKGAILTRHHVVPKRHKKKIPKIISSCMSNVLFVCADCHTKYERHSEKEPNDGITDPVELVRAWRDHFINTMKPQFLPIGWDIFSIKPEELNESP